MRWGGEGGDELIDVHVAEAFERRDVDVVLETRQGRLTGQVRTFGRPTGNQLEGRIEPQRVVVVLIFVISEDAVDTHPHHVEHGMFKQFGITGIVQSGGELLGEADAFIKLTDGQ